MGIEKNETTNKRAEIEILCQRNKELLRRVDIMLGMDTSLETFSTREILIVAGQMIDENKKHIAELEAMLRNDGQRQHKEGYHD